MIFRDRHSQLTAWVERLRPALSHLPETIKRPLRNWVVQRGARELLSRGATDDADYAARVAQETWIFTDQVEVHDLPPIFHYW
ncbi:MAG TPA: hypothetical protein VFG55_07180, partial [Rhodanobacteraceae bacterium]|nr:hypothetical protein [Rhodanobacteraceae bacterium]